MPGGIGQDHDRLLWALRVAVGPMGTQLELLRLFWSARQDETPFNQRQAELAVGHLGRDLAGAVVLDVGCGPGHYTRGLRGAGAWVLPIDLKVVDQQGGPPRGLVLGDARGLPVGDATVDGAFCSNLLEHTPDPAAVVAEIERVLRPGGWAWLSFTNWYSPYGGHDMSPWHYLGPRAGTAVFRRIKGRAPVCEPGRSLFPLHVGQALRIVERRPGLRLIDAIPRYYPSQRWIVRVPGLREVATWNCLLLLERASV